jgi:hypothetical protein
VCKVFIGAFYDLSAEIVRVHSALIKNASWSLGGGKSFAPGRVVILRNGVSIRRGTCPSSSLVHSISLAILRFYCETLRTS